MELNKRRVSCAYFVRKSLLDGWMDGWKDGWKEGWMEAKAGLRIAYSNQKRLKAVIWHLLQFFGSLKPIFLVFITPLLGT